MYSQISYHLEKYDLVCNEQFGFRKGRSTINAMDSLVKTVLDIYESKGYAKATFCDLSKAFDCVDHGILLEKLLYYGIRGTSHNLVKSFLSERKQVVCIGSDKSDVVKLNHGVPQGSVLGPLFFILMINDLPAFVGTRSILYADDTTFLNSNLDLTELQMQTVDTLNKASLWFKANGLCLNDSKTQQMTFSLRIDPVSQDPESIKFLGLYMDSKLSWEPHLKYICTRLSRVIYLLRKLKDCVPDNYVKSAYFAFFQSIISYGILLWGNSSHIQELLILQKKVIRVITDSDKHEHCKPLFVKLGFLTVVNLYIYHALIYTKQNLHTLPLNEEVHDHYTRNCKKINVPFNRLSKSLNSYHILGLKMFNVLPLELSSLPLDTFKNQLYCRLSNSPFYSISEFFDTRFK